MVVDWQSHGPGFESTVYCLIFYTIVFLVCHFITNFSLTLSLSDPSHLATDHYRTYFHLHNMTDYTVVNATLYFYIQRPGRDRNRSGDYKYKVHVYKYITEDRVGTSAEFVTHKVCNTAMSSFSV